MSDKINARFLTPVMTPDANKKTIKVAGKPFEYVDLDENTAKMVLEQASLYSLKDRYSHELEYDDDPNPSKSSGIKEFELARLTSISSTTAERLTTQLSGAIFPRRTAMPPVVLYGFSTGRITSGFLL